MADRKPLRGRGRYNSGMSIPTDFRKRIISTAKEVGIERVRAAADDPSRLGKEVLKNIARTYGTTPEQTRRMILEVLSEMENGQAV